jgi:hypothetical protein
MDAAREIAPTTATMILVIRLYDTTVAPFVSRRIIVGARVNESADYTKNISNSDRK